MQEDFSKNELAHVIHESMEMCNKYNYLIRIGTVSAAISLLVSLVLWPTRINTLFPGRFEIFEMFSLDAVEALFARDFMLALWLSLGFGFIFLINLIFPLWANASVISSVYNLKNDPTLKLGFWRSLWIGARKLIVLFEYEALTVFFDLTKLGFVAYILAIVIGVDGVLDFWPIFLIAGLFQLFFSILLVYGKYNVVITGGNIFKSIQKSMTLVVFYMSETFMLLAILGLLIVLIAMYAVLYFAFPALIIALLDFVLNRFSDVVALYVVGVVSLIMFYFFAKLIGYAQVLLSTMWTLTFLELSQRKEHRLVDGDNE